MFRTVVLVASLAVMTIGARADDANPQHWHISPPVAAGVHSADDFYPEEAKRLAQEGDVTVNFLIRTDGTVSDVTVAKSSTFPLLDAAAVAAVSTWHYLPAMQDGKPVEYRWTAVLKFREDESPPPASVYSVVDAPQSAYPQDALAQKQQGAVTLEILLDESGRVLGVSVRLSSGSASLDAASITLARQHWHFSPASVDGKPLKTVLFVMVNWLLPANVPANPR